MPATGTGSDVGPRPSPDPAACAHQPVVIVLTAAVAGVPASIVLAACPSGAWWIVAAAMRPPGLHCWPDLACARLQNSLPDFILLLAVAATAGAWHHCRWYLMSPPTHLGCFARRKDQPACVEATVVRMPRRLPTPAFDPLRMMPANEGWRLDVDLRGHSRRVTLACGLRPNPICRARPAAGGPRRRSGAMFRTAFGACWAAESWRVSILPPTSAPTGIHCRLAGEVPECLSVVRPGGWLSFRGHARSSAQPTAIGCWKNTCHPRVPKWPRPSCWANGNKSSSAAPKTSWPPARSTCW